MSFSVSWIAPNGTSPKASQPITFTIVDPAIKAGDVIYVLTPQGLQVVGTATVNGTVTMTFTTDPDFIVAAVPRLTAVGATGRLKGLAIDVTIRLWARREVHWLRDGHRQGGQGRPGAQHGARKG